MSALKVIMAQFACNNLGGFPSQVVCAAAKHWEETTLEVTTTTGYNEPVVCLRVWHLNSVLYFVAAHKYAVRKLKLLIITDAIFQKP